MATKINVFRDKSNSSTPFIDYVYYSNELGYVSKEYLTNRLIYNGTVSEIFESTISNPIDSLIKKYYYANQTKLSQLNSHINDVAVTYSSNLSERRIFFPYYGNTNKLIKINEINVVEWPIYYPLPIFSLEYTLSNASSNSQYFKCTGSGSSFQLLTKYSNNTSQTDTYTSRYDYSNVWLYLAHEYYFWDNITFTRSHYLFNSSDNLSFDVYFVLFNSVLKNSNGWPFTNGTQSEGKTYKNTSIKYTEYYLTSINGLTSSTYLNIDSLIRNASSLSGKIRSGQGEKFYVLCEPINDPLFNNTSTWSCINNLSSDSITDYCRYFSTYAGTGYISQNAFDSTYGPIVSNNIYTILPVIAIGTKTYETGNGTNNKKVIYFVGFLTIKNLYYNISSSATSTIYTPKPTQAIQTWENICVDAVTGTGIGNPSYYKDGTITYEIGKSSIMTYQENNYYKLVEKTNSYDY